MFLTTARLSSHSQMVMQGRCPFGCLAGSLLAGPPPLMFAIRIFPISLPGKKIDIFIITLVADLLGRYSLSAFTTFMFARLLLKYRRVRARLPR